MKSQLRHIKPEKLKSYGGINGLIETVLTPGQGCQECLAMHPRGQWVHLRTNLGDGATLCCDSSPHQHSTKHAKATGLPLVTSVEPGETWIYDYRTGSYL